MNLLRLTGEIRIVGTDHDARMRDFPFLMQADEVQSILRKKNSTLGGGKLENVLIRNRPVCVPGIERSEDIVTQPSKLLNDWKGYVFVRVESRHQADSFSWIWASICAECARTKAQALARSSARRDG